MKANHMKLISSKNPKLKTPSEDVTDFKEGKQIGKALLKFLRNQPTACGIAAVQVGILKSIFVIRWRGINRIVINPAITYYSTRKEKKEEWCLSYPGISKHIKRSIEIEVKYHDGEKEVKETLTGYIARIFQHQYELLFGNPFVG